jgi:hypothetical protein
LLRAVSSVEVATVGALDESLGGGDWRGASEGAAGFGGVLCIEVGERPGAPAGAEVRLCIHQAPPMTTIAMTVATAAILIRRSAAGEVRSVAG